MRLLCEGLREAERSFVRIHHVAFHWIYEYLGRITVLKWGVWDMKVSGYTRPDVYLLGKAINRRSYWCEGLTANCCTLDDTGV